MKHGTRLDWVEVGGDAKKRSLDLRMVLIADAVLWAVLAALTLPVIALLH